MQKRCNRCFELYEKNKGVCPFCGHSETVKVQSSHFLQPGTTLKGGRFIVGEQIGQGSVGIVYKAWDKRLHRTIAIKEFFPDSLATRAEGMMSVMVYSTQDVNEYEKLLKTFKREARIMSLVTDSENCLKAFDIFEENGTAYITMEYLEAQKLSEFLQSGNRQALSEKDINAIMMKLSEGISELHEKGICHLDLSPDKIFIRKNDDRFEIKIFSFDSAVLKSDIKRGVEIEKRAYSGFRAPELVGHGGRIGAWTDVYALGAIYYYLLTGSVPKNAGKSGSESLVPESDRYETVSEWIRVILKQALATACEQRYSDAGEFREVLAYRMEREEKEQLAQEEEATEHTGKANKFLLTVLVILAAVAVVGAYFVLASRTKTDISVWVAADIDTGLEKARYESVITAFEEAYPEITVSLEVMDRDSLTERLLSTRKQDLPDLVETTYVTRGMLDGFCSLSALTNELSSNWVIAGLRGIETVDTRKIPLGFYTTVGYRQAETGEELQAGSVSEFIQGNAGYVDSDTTIYSMVQKNLPGRYEVVEATDKIIYLAEVFSVAAQTGKEEKAAKKLLSFMMTDAAQEMIHITHRSEYLPITVSMFEVYVRDVFSELQFLSDAIQTYEIID